MDPVSSEFFLKHAELLNKNIERQIDLVRDDIKGTHLRLDAINGRVRKGEEDMAVLKHDSASTAKWRGSIFGAIFGLVATLAAMVAQHYWFP